MIQNLKDSVLLGKVEDLAHEERRVTAELLEHLREVDRRKLYCDKKCSSLFEFCTTILKYSDSSAQRRVEAVRLMWVLPEVKEKVQSGVLSLSTVSKAQSFFRKESKALGAIATEQKREILKSLEGLSSRQAERKLLSQSSQPEIHFQEKVRSVTETHTKVEVLFNQEQLSAFEKVRGLLAHSHPNLNWADLFEVMAKKLIADLDPTRKPQRNVSPARQQDPDTRRPTAAMKREIFSRDESHCQQCGSTYALQIDHKQAWAMGGQTKKENLRVLCRNCNQREAIKFFGANKVEKYLKV